MCCDNPSYIIDTMYVCSNCGVVDTNYPIFDTVVDTHSTHVHRIHRYNRTKSFVNFLHKKHLDRTTIIQLKNLFNRILPFFNKYCDHKKKFILFDYFAIVFLRLLHKQCYIDRFKKITNPKTINKYNRIWNKIQNDPQYQKT